MLGGLMEIKEIRQLIKLVESADITEIEIVEEGKTETIFRWPQHLRTKKLVTAYQSLVPQQTL